MTYEHSDPLDRAADLAERERAAALARTRAVAIPAGAPGICEDCEEQSPRLVGRRCARCRDGR